MKRAIGFILGLCFIVGAILHYNKPDMAAWVALCFIAAAFCFVAAYGKAGKPLLILLAIVSAAEAMYA